MQRFFCNLDYPCQSAVLLKSRGTNLTAFSFKLAVWGVEVFFGERAFGLRHRITLPTPEANSDFIMVVSGKRLVLSVYFFVIFSGFCFASLGKGITMLGDG